MRREIVRKSHFADGVKRQPASVVEKWGSDHGFRFPKEFVDFFAEFGGSYLEERWGYEYMSEKDDSPDFAVIDSFLHFDPDVVMDSVDDEYTLRCTDHWNQPLLVPFAFSEIVAFAVLDFRKSRHAPAVYNVDFFDTSKDDPDRPNMTWLADSFADFLNLLEPYKSFLTRYGEEDYEAQFEE